MHPTLVAGVVLTAFLMPPAVEAEDVDFLIHRATVLDGSGSPPIQADIAIRGERIAAIGDLANWTSARTIDAAGLMVAPGFIDLHTHSDDPIQKDNTRANLNYLLQGVTTVVTGNCGGGPTDVAKMFSIIEQNGAGTNVIHLIPHGSVRRQIVGEANRKATADELSRMKQLVDREMSHGTWGMSTGLIYTPGCYASTEELIELCKVVAAHRGFYASHIRGEDWDSLLDSIGEAIRIGREGGLPAHISHLKASGPRAWGMMPAACNLMERARADGLVVTADQYPYVASSTNLAAMTVPSEEREGGNDVLAKRLKDAETSAALRNRIAKTLAERGGGKTIRIASYAKQAPWQGKSLEEIAAMEGRDELDITIEILSNGGASAVSFGMSEDDVRLAMQKPYVATASDGGAKVPDKTVPHPRSYGCFPRKIGRYAIEQRVIPLEFAVRSATGLPADILNLPERGYLKPGYSADIVAFDPTKFRDTATFENPHQYARGMQFVWINGKLAIDRGEFTETLAGRPLRHQSPWVVYDGFDGPGKGKHIVLISGDEEYRSEETLPQLGKILAKHHGFKCTVLFAVDPNDGTINPNESNIPGLEALQSADLMIIFTRFRDLPDDQMKYIVDYVESGRPIIGLRTATHAFNINADKKYAKYSYNSGVKEYQQGFGRQVLGETWISHHGQHGKQATRGVIAPGAAGHPILRGIKDGDIFGPTDVYTVRLPLPGDSTPLVLGQVLTGMSATGKSVDGSQNDPMMPIAWTKTYAPAASDGGADHASRVFTTTMGASQDFSSLGLRRLLVNASYWTLGLQEKIPEDSKVDLVGDYQPLPFGHNGFAKGVKPADHAIK
jgi:N-acyl-D-aspartate/D-glutamate deacylase